MRIVRIRLKPDVVTSLNQLAKEYNMEDPGFVHDLFALFRKKGSGLPTDDRLAAMAEVYVKKTEASFKSMVTMHMRQRRFVFVSIIALPFFKSLCLECEKTPIEATRRLIQTFRELNIKRRQASCLTCQYLKQCDFGKQYGDIAADISKVVDPDYAKKVHADCPDLPEIDQTNQMFQAAQAMQALGPTGTVAQMIAKMTGQAGRAAVGQMAKEEEALEENEEVNAPEADTDDEAGLDPEEQAEDMGPMPVIGAPGAKGMGGKGGTHLGRNFAKVQEQFVRNLSVAQLQLFELGRVLDQMLKQGLKGKYKPTREVSNTKEEKRIQDSSEIAKVDTGEHAKSDEVFDIGFAKKELRVAAFKKPEERKQLLYGLCDVSGSMSSAICGANRNSLLTRAHVAATLLASLCKRVQADQGMMFLRWFSDSPGPLYSARTDREFPTLMNDIVRCDFNGGGTSIINALRRAHGDITSARDEIAQAEVLLVTDMDDNLTAADTAWIATAFDLKKGVKLNVLDVNSERPSGNAHVELKRVATKYLKINAGNLNIQDIVELVK